MTALPGPPDALAMPGPTPPTLSLLAWGTGKAKETLKTPDKVLKAWWDGNFAIEFRDFVEAARQTHELDVKVTDDSGPATKKRRVMDTAPKQDPVPVPNPESVIDSMALGDLPTLCYEAKVTANPKLVLKVTIGQGVFLENQTDVDESIKAGVVLCGYYKGKFWSPDSTPEEPSEKSDVIFRISSNNDRVMFNSNWVTLGEIIRAKRELTPAGAIVGYHDLVDCPTPEDPSAFRFEPKKMTVYFKVFDFPSSVKAEDGDGGDSTKLMIPAAHLAGTVPAKVWNGSALTEVTWAVKWPAVAAKGLQPVRPMVVTAKQFVIKSKSAVVIAKPNA